MEFWIVFDFGWVWILTKVNKYCLNFNFNCIYSKLLAIELELKCTLPYLEIKILSKDSAPQDWT